MTLLKDDGRRGVETALGKVVPLLSQAVVDGIEEWDKIDPVRYLQRLTVSYVMRGGDTVTNHHI